MHIEVVRATFVHLKMINCVEQTFHAALFIEARIESGAMDADLSRPSGDWPTSPSSDGSYRPSALWYLNKQLEYPNALEVKIVESKTFNVGDDLCLVQRVDGIFTAVMDLVNFPFDTQRLTIEVLLKCVPLIASADCLTIEALLKCMPLIASDCF